MTSQIGEKVKGGPNGREGKNLDKLSSGSLLLWRRLNYNWEARRFGGAAGSLGLLKDAVGLVENHGKANPTDTELLPNFMRVA